MPQHRFIPSGVTKDPALCFRSKPWPEKLAVRQCEPRDAGDLYALFSSESYQRSGALLDPFSSPSAVADWLEGNRQGNFQIVGLHDETAVGFAGLYPLKGRQSHTGLVSIGVNETFQRRGYGRALLATLVATADFLAGLTRLQLTVLADNEPAIALYETYGFMIEGRHIGFASHDGRHFDALTMARIRAGVCA